MDLIKFDIEDIRIGKKAKGLTGKQFNEQILRITKARYENRYVLLERTGERPKIISYYLNNIDSLVIHSNVFLVSAGRRLNSDKRTRYLILIDDERYDRRITEMVYDYVPIYAVKVEGMKRESEKASPLSKWFGQTMGRGFSFIDIDYIITNKECSKVVVVEEKVKEELKREYAYGQLLSYQELLTDVINKDAKFIFCLCFKQWPV